MRNLWLKLGCFFTGYNYRLVTQCSEATAKTVNKYFSAMLVVCTVWAFIGLAFSSRYLHASLPVAGIFSFVMIFIVVQIERQIILSVSRNGWAYIFRAGVGLVMALIGAVIADQIVFNDDIEKMRISRIQEEVNRILPEKTRQLDLQIRQLDTLILARETERSRLLEEISRSPRIFLPTINTEFEKDSAGNLIPASRSIVNQAVPNPRIGQVTGLEQQLAILRQQKADKEKNLLNMRSEIEQDLQSKTGLLDEIKTLTIMLKSSLAGLFVWTIFFLFFLFIELFILVNKAGDGETDYDCLVRNQMELRKQQIHRIFDVPSSQKRVV
ncbi:MAG TPA: DUF4407 domain-containing protein [Bacteroidales bacterium]|nr:DUF4407 domain-containing protein [Bacteroidales bacterium]